MLIEAWDTVFVRCPRDAVHQLCAHVPTWPCWWPGLEVDTLDGVHHLLLRPPVPALLELVGVGGVRPGRPLHLELRVDTIRPAAKGLRFSLAGDLRGEGEWFYLDERAGVTVHHLVKGEVPDRRARRVTATLRASVRGALTELKDRLEAGRVPGAEPDPRLLAHQEAALAAYAAELERAATDDLTAAGSA